MSKWWTYQRERFPLVAHGALIASFSFCAVSLSHALRGAAGWPSWRSLVVAFGSCFAFFLQLRIADEFKDADDDARYRPYRPVPRGLVTLRELAVVFALAAVAQLLLALWLDVRLVILLAITWTYLAAMSREFFVAEWLRPRYVLYMVSHMVIMPLVDLYATSTDWLVAGGKPPDGLLWFLLTSYCNGLNVEIGRKIRSPADEEEGVATYSRLWGRPRAVLSWRAVTAASGCSALIVASRLGLAWPEGAILLVGFIGMLGLGIAFLRRSEPGQGKWIEHASGAWTLLLYLSLGLTPHIIGRLR